MADTYFGIPIKYLSLLILVVQNSLLVIVMRYSRIVSSIKYYSSTAVFFCELFKLIVCLIVYLKYEFTFVNLNSFKTLFGLVFSGDSWKMVIPAFLYTIQNNLQYAAVSLLDPATFQVSYQLKILTTALFSVIILRKYLDLTKWLSLILLTLGVAIVQLQSVTDTPSSQKETDSLQRFRGLLAVAVACVISGLAGVYFELVLKSSSKSLWLRNVQLSFYSLLPAVLGIIFTDGSGIAENGFFYGYTSWTVGSILCQSVGGIIVAVVVKYADNILKGFATSLSIILSCLLSVWIFDFELSLMFAIGASVVIYSTYLYGQPSEPSKQRTSEAPDYVPLQTTSRS
ncbi:hypothetical protein BB560_001240 [Smittium megazygosporum]|uniref:UDP-galactose transporter n=1 Tax=Smittium megazygosporum TaxID=133381 RepID=A0A2T9ZI49_9FUNG|nr:hypothetical protein BB560_001240 [Smittium megazygosporum]